MSRCDVFISYRRDGGDISARLLYDKLVQYGYSVFMDVEEIDPGDFEIELRRRIEQCKDFLLVISKGALDPRELAEGERDWLMFEIETALELKKTIIPVLFDGTRMPQARNLPEGIRPLNMHTAITANGENFDSALKKIRRFMKSKTPLEKFMAVLKPTLLILLGATAAIVSAFLIVRSQPVQVSVWINGEKLPSEEYFAVNPGDEIRIQASRLFSDVEYLEYELEEITTDEDGTCIVGEIVLSGVEAADTYTFTAPERNPDIPHYHLNITAYDVNPTGRKEGEIGTNKQYHLCYEMHKVEKVY